MCVIVSKPPTATLTRERASRLWNQNPHGGGFTFVDKDGRVQIQKDMDFDGFWHRYKSALGRNPEAHFVLHMRIATHGSVGLDNVHPFRVDDHTVMAHNGMIDIQTKYPMPEGFKVMPGKYYEDPWDRSDTRIFIEEVLSELPETWLDDPHLVDMVEGYIGGSKLTFLTTNPALKKGVYILNEMKGTERDGMWFSNSLALDPKPEVKGFYTRAGSIDMWDDRGWDDWEEGIVVNPKPLTQRNSPVKSIVVDGKLKSVHVSSKTFEDYLKDIRKNRLHLYVDIEYMRELDDWVCFDCEEFVDTNTASVTVGDCACWDKWCATCDQAPFDCRCSGTVRNLVSAWQPDLTQEQECSLAISLEERR